MSRYPSKTELVDVIKHTVATDWNKLGTPKTLKAFNVSGIIRDLKPMGGYPYGWTFEVCDAEGFKRAVYSNLRPSYRQMVPTEAEHRALEAHQDEDLTSIRALLDPSGTCTCCDTDFTDDRDVTPARGPLPETL